MMTLQLQSITKYTGSRKLLKDISFTLNKGQRVGVLGRNGCGKSTLFKLIFHEVKPDAGAVIIPEGIRVEYLPQGFCELHQKPHISIREFLEEPFVKYLKLFASLEEKMKDKSGKLLDNILNEYGKAQDEFFRSGGYDYKDNLSFIFKKLDIHRDITPDSNFPFLNLSGGQRLKLTLARMLVSSPDLLLLDEPTNYLDIKSLLWLENYLITYSGALLVVSHDRKFLDKLATSIIEISITDGSMREYEGNYRKYCIEKEREKEKHWQRYYEQQEKINNLRSDIRNTKNHARKTEESTVNDQLRRYAKKVAKKAKSREKRLERLISEENLIEKPWALENIRINLKSGIKKGKSLITLQNVSFNFPEKNDLFRNISLNISCGDKIALMGSNGSGKSTLFKILAGKLQPSKGEVIVWPDTLTAYLPQDEGEVVDLEKTVLQEFRSEISLEEGEARTFLHRMLFKGEDVFKKVECLSYGERIKLVLAKIMASGANTLLLDEPTGHLDIDSVERLEKALLEFQGGLFVISHDRFFLEKLSIDKLYVLERGRISEYSEFEDYEKKILQ